MKKQEEALEPLIAPITAAWIWLSNAVIGLGCYTLVEHALTPVVVAILVSHVLLEAFVIFKSGLLKGFSFHRCWIDIVCITGPPVVGPLVYYLAWSKRLTKQRSV